MAKKDRAAGLTSKYDADALARMALDVKASGFLPGAYLRERFGADAYTQGVALLYRDFRLFREVRRPWGDDGKEALGYEWADRRFSKSEAKTVPEHLGFIVELCSAPRPKYGDFQDVTARCRWTAPILGSVPIKDEHGDPTNHFERNRLGSPLILRYHQRAMASVALPQIGSEAAIARRIGWRLIVLPSSIPVKIVEHGIVEQGRPGGKGLRRSECIADGLEFTIRARVPTSALSVAQFLEMLHVAGETVGLSPGRSAGFGDFEVLEASGEELPVPRNYRGTGPDAALAESAK